MAVTDVYRYPVKSCRGERQDGAPLEPWGPSGGRIQLGAWTVITVSTADSHQS